MLSQILRLSLFSAILLSVGCMKGSFLLKGSACQNGLCAAEEAAAPKLAASACEDPDLASLKAGSKLTLCDGTVGVGTYSVAATDDLLLCSQDGQQDCVAKGDFKAIKPSSIDPSDVRIGKTIAGVSGADPEMKQCRNAADLGFWDASSLANANSGTWSPNSIAEDWDTIDDYNNGTLTPPVDGPWGSAYVCDPNNFTNVSALGLPGLTPTGTTPAGANVVFSQIWRDDLTGVYFTNIIKSVTAGSNWQGIMDMCANLDSGDGPGKWRLPTQKELLQLYIDGISRLAVSGGAFGYYFWTSTKDSTNSNALALDLSNSYTENTIARTNTTTRAICVR